MPSMSLLSSLVVVRRRAETSRGGRAHRVWRGGLVRPGAIGSAVRRRRCSTAGRAFGAIIRPIRALLHDGGG